ncbi:MAG: hypothetical protein U0165_07740 [Polyangiaceae bacterium]
MTNRRSYFAGCFGWVAMLCMMGCSGDDSVSSSATPTPRACLGATHLCDRTLPEITLAATHNAFSYADGGDVVYLYPNQDLPIPDQLAYGIRALGIRPCPYFGSEKSEKGKVYVTHNSSLKGALGEEPLLGILQNVKKFLDDNPNEVVEFLAESTVTPAEIANVFEQAGLTSYLYEHDAKKGWPTIGEMIDSGKRIVFFNDSQDADRPAWQLYMWDFIVDTDYNITDESQFKCEYYRGNASNPLYFLNQFIYKDLGNDIFVPDKINAQTANDPTKALARAKKCQTEKSRQPNFIYVDWFGQGNVKQVVDALNQPQ